MTPANNTSPRIAALIPAFNEELVIESTINGLIGTGFAKADIYVVDDKSTDRTRELAAATGVNVYTVPENGGKAQAQIAALKYFLLCDRYDWVVFLDGDTKVGETFLHELRSAALESKPDVGLLVGQVKSSKEDHIYSAFRAFEFTFSHDVCKIGQNNFGVVYVSPGCSSMYRTSVLRQLDIDSNTLAEDMDLTIQVHRLDKKVKYVHKAVVHTQDPSTLTDYNKQVLRWYRGFWQVVLKHSVLAWGRKQRVDFYMWLIIFDALFMNKFFWLFGLVMIFPNIWYTLAIDVGVAFAIASYCAYRTRRWDVITKFPIYYWLTFINTIHLFRSFFEIIIFRRKLLAWNKVKRYQFSN